MSDTHPLQTWLSTDSHGCVNALWSSNIIITLASCHATRREALAPCESWLDVGPSNETYMLALHGCWIANLAVIGGREYSSHDEFTTTKSANVNSCFHPARPQSLINGWIQQLFVNMTALPSNQFQRLESGVQNIRTTTGFRTKHYISTIESPLRKRANWNNMRHIACAFILDSVCCRQCSSKVRQSSRILHLHTLYMTAPDETLSDWHHFIANISRRYIQPTTMSSVYDAGKTYNKLTSKLYTIFLFTTKINILFNDVSTTGLSYSSYLMSKCR